MTTENLFSTITSYMDEAERHYEADVEDGVISLDMQGDDGEWSIYISVIDDDEIRRVLIHSYLSVRIPEINRLKVAEQIARFNYDMSMGNFGLSMDDGNVFFKTAVDLADGQITPIMFERMYGLNACVMNDHYAQILSVGFGGEVQVKAPAEAIPEGSLLQ